MIVKSHQGNLEARRVRQLWLTTLPAVRAWLKQARHRPGPRPGQGRGRPRPPEPASGEERVLERPTRPEPLG